MSGLIIKPKVGSKELGVGLRFGRKNILTQQDVGLQYWIVVTLFPRVQPYKGETWQITEGRLNTLDDEPCSHTNGVRTKRRVTHQD